MKLLGYWPTRCPKCDCGSRYYRSPGVEPDHWWWKINHVNAGWRRPEHLVLHCRSCSADIRIRTADNFSEVRRPAFQESPI